MSTKMERFHNLIARQAEEIEGLKERVEKWKTWHDSADEDAKKWRRDAQKFYAALQKIIETGDKISVKYEAVHLVRIAREALEND